jgi:hypothetical protein
VWQQLHHVLLDQLGRQGQLDWLRASLDSLSVRAKRGPPDRPEPDRPRQARLQVPPAGRPARHPAGRRAVGRQHPRLDAAGADGRRRPPGQGPVRAAWAAAQAPGQAALRQGVRLPALPSGAAPARHHAQDRPARHRAEPAAGPPPVRGGAVAGVAGRLPAAAGPLRAARGHPARVPPPGLRTHLPQLPEPDAPSSTVPFGAVRSGGMTARTTT